MAPTTKIRSEAASKALALTDLDRELLALAAEVEKCAQSARNVVLRADTQAHVERFASVEAHKELERDRMGRMLRAWRGVRDEEGAPYRDARMLLTDAIFFHATVLRNAPRDEARQLRLAEQAAALVARHYPRLAARMGEADRLERIRAAIASCAASTRRRPWKLIAATWDGIEAAPVDGETWRKKWHSLGTVRGV